MRTAPPVLHWPSPPCAHSVRQDVDFLVPNRFEYGYGLTPEIVALAAQNKPDLIITVDNGISSLEGVAAARDLGIATLITDHHLAGRELPDADVIVNPNQPGCAFASKNLAGVGVIFYIMLALRAELRSRDWFAARPRSTWVITSTWSPWAPWQMWSHWIAITVSWLPPAWRVYARARRGREFMPCWKRARATINLWWPPTWVLPWARASMPPGGWTICPSVLPVC